MGILYCNLYFLIKDYIIFIQHSLISMYRDLAHSLQWLHSVSYYGYLMKLFLIYGPLGYSQFFIIIQNTSLNILMNVSWAIWTIITKSWNYQIRDIHSYYHTALQKVYLNLYSFQQCVDCFSPSRAAEESIPAGWQWFGWVVVPWVFAYLYIALPIFPLQNTFAFITNRLIQYLIKNQPVQRVCLWDLLLSVIMG